MANLTRNISDKSQVKIDGVVSLQAANGEGARILEEILKYSQGGAYTIPVKLNYSVKAKCWTNHKGSIVLFNLAENPSLAINYVKAYLSGAKAKVEKTDTGATPLAGILTTDRGDIIAPDTGTETEKTAVKVDRKK